MSAPLRDYSIKASSMLFTIGYEGRSIDEYTSILNRQGVRLVVDVRRNPLSRKKGFSKSSLSDALQRSGIAYVHIPDLGIESSLRKDLQSDADYFRLFKHYEEELLPNATDALEELDGLIKFFGTAALTCFERDPKHCHRHCVANYAYTNGFITEKAIDL